MNKRGNWGNLAYWGLLGATESAAIMACTRVDPVPPGDTSGAAPVTACGSLDATLAAQFAAERLEHLATAGPRAVSGLENCRSARVTGRLETDLSLNRS